MVFPELRDSVWSVHQKSCYQLLLEYPGAHSLAYAHLTRLTNLIAAGSRSKYGKTKAIELRNLARNSIGIDSTALSMELQQTICLVLSIKEQLAELNNEIKRMVKSLESPLLTIPGISFILGGIILSEINDISMFSNPAKLLAFAGLEPSMFQSGKYVADTTPMVKRGSTYLRWALLNAARLVVMRDNTFSEYYWKKRTEGKHHNVALSHTARKLVRVIFHILKTGKPFITQS